MQTFLVQPTVEAPSSKDLELAKEKMAKANFKDMSLPEDMEHVITGFMRVQLDRKKPVDLLNDDSAKGNWYLAFKVLGADGQVRPKGVGSVYSSVQVDFKRVECAHTYNGLPFKFDEANPEAMFGKKFTVTKTKGFVGVFDPSIGDRGDFKPAPANAEVWFKIEARPGQKFEARTGTNTNMHFVD